MIEYYFPWEFQLQFPDTSKSLITEFFSFHLCEVGACDLNHQYLSQFCFFFCQYSNINIIFKQFIWSPSKFVSVVQIVNTIDNKYWLHNGIHLFRTRRMCNKYNKCGRCSAIIQWYVVTIHTRSGQIPNEESHNFQEFEQCIKSLRMITLIDHYLPYIWIAWVQKWFRNK